MTRSTGKRPVIIAEAGVNHNGRRDLALRLVDAAADAGADLVKFQAFSADTLASDASPAASYQRERTGASAQRAMLKALELSADDFAAVAAHCRSRGIGFLCTPFDVEQLDALIALGMPAVKVASGELTNHPALRRFGASGLPVYLSTGMATLAEVRAALDALRAAGAGEVTALHCTSLYPAPPETLNLAAIATLREALATPVGYSDHSLGAHMAVAATALGACVIEKHLTLDRAMQGPDHAASLEPEPFARMVREIHEVAAALGDGEKRPHPLEAETAYVARRSWHATRDLPVGAVLGAGDMALLRPAAGAPGDRALEGRRLLAPVAAGAPIREDALAPDAGNGP
ncbi:MAG: N-acetylneuraminate synthase family protein [Alphaproteobacteria bacterium]|nr:N-acetylneuraminate synthase family protein [Alphaproteobacteria bacterium]